MPLVTSGVEKGNLRELALARMASLGLRCRDVRTREAGIQDIHHQVCRLCLNLAAAAVYLVSVPVCELLYSTKDAEMCVYVPDLQLTKDLVGDRSGCSAGHCTWCYCTRS